MYSQKIDKKVVIKIATVADLEILALLGRVTYSESHGEFIPDQEDLIRYNSISFSIENTKNNLKNPKNVYHILYVDDFPVGYTKIILNENFDTQKTLKNCRLERIYILKEFIPLKLGNLLMKNAIDFAKQKQFQTIWLSVYIKNYRAIHFYQKHQFEEIGRLDFMVNGKKYENFVLEKTLL